MNILVCMKQVPDTTEVRLGEDLTLERDFVASVMNPADESALELGMQMRDALGGKVTVLSMGPQRVETMLREAISRGADEAVQLTDPTFAGADTLITAKTLRAAVDALGGFDLILCGRRAVDGETGQVGPMLAALLDIPCVPNATALRVDADKTAVASQLTEGGVQEWRCPLPALITLCEWSYRLRLPTLSGLRAAGRAAIRRLSPAQVGLAPDRCGLKASPTRVVGVSARPVGARPCRKVNVAEALHALDEGRVLP